VRWDRDRLSRKKAIPVADFAKIRGQNKQAKELAEKYSDAVSGKIRTLRSVLGGIEPTWDEITTIATTTAIEVLGERQPIGGKPWSEGKDADKAILGKAVVATKEWHTKLLKRPRPWNEETAGQIEKARKMRKTAQTTRAKVIQGWENNWWEQLAEKAEGFLEDGNIVGAYRALKEIRERGKSKMHDVINNVPDPEVQREAWRAHFASISNRPYFHILGECTLLQLVCISLYCS
jgi:hypothetical protein